MAYTPSLADFEAPPQGGYTPSAADFEAPQNVPRVTPAPSETHAPLSVNDRMLASLLHQQSPFGKQKETDPGAKDEGLVTSMAKGVVDFVPSMVLGQGAVKGLSKIPKVAEFGAKYAANSPKLSKIFGATAAENAISGAHQGATHAEKGDMAAGGAVGGGIGALSTLINPALGIPVKYLAKKYAQSAIPEFTQKATDLIREKTLPVSEYAKLLTERYLGKANKNQQNWKAAETTAQNIDNSMMSLRKPEIVGHDAAGAPIYKAPTLEQTVPFKNDPYHAYIDKYKTDVGALEPARRAEHEHGIMLADRAKELAPESFMGMIHSSKNINRDLSDYMEQKGIPSINARARDFLGGLKKTIREDLITANEGKVEKGLMNQFKNEWETANKSHQELQDFYNYVRPGTGNLAKNKQVKEAFQKSSDELPIDEAVLNKFLPSLTDRGVKGTEGLKHLEKMFGNKELAQDAAKASLFNRALDKGANTIDTAAIYSKMSPAQRKQIFGNSEEGKMLEAINKSRLQFGREPEKTLAKIGHGVTSLGIPGLIGFGGALASGDSWDKSLMYGFEAAAASKGIKGISAKTATPRSVERAINIGKKGVNINPKLSNLMLQENANPYRRND